MSLGILTPESVKELETLFQQWAQHYRFGHPERRWHPPPGATIQKGKTAEAITVGSVGNVTLWKGIHPDEAATTVVVPCKNYYHDIDAGQWVHFIRLKPDYGELIAGKIC